MIIFTFRLRGLKSFEREEKKSFLHYATDVLIESDVGRFAQNLLFNFWFFFRINFWNL